MDLWLISRPDDDIGYDEYDSAVVAAESAEDAKLVHPGEGYRWADGAWRYADGRPAVSCTWTIPSEVSVRLVGKAAEGTERGVVLASFNAG